MRTRWRTAAISVPVCLGALLAPVPASAAAACQATILPTLGHEHTEVTGGDPSGRYLVGSTSNMDSLLWVRGEPRLLDTEPVRPYVEARPTGVNRRGVVIGYRMSDYSFHTDAWAYRNGRFTLLPGLTATESTMPEAINSRGDVVGTSLSADPALPWHGVVWPADRPGTVRELTVPGQPGETFAVGIDEDGTVLGHLDGRPGETPYIWPRRGAPYPLVAPPGVDFASAVAIRNGWVVGCGQQGDQLVGLRWNLSRHTAQTTSTEYTNSLSVNRSGTTGAVGALVHRDGRTVPLGDDARPLVVTDRGTAAGNTSQFFGEPVLWTGC